MPDRELTIQRLKILISKNVLSDHFREAVENAVMMLISDDVIRCCDCVHQENCQLDRSMKGEALRSGNWFCGDAIRR